jgi:hypothetical protein
MALEDALGIPQGGASFQTGEGAAAPQPQLAGYMPNQEPQVGLDELVRRARQGFPKQQQKPPVDYSKYGETPKPQGPVDYSKYGEVPKPAEEAKKPEEKPQEEEEGWIFLKGVGRLQNRERGSHRRNSRNRKTGASRGERIPARFRCGRHRCQKSRCDRIQINTISPYLTA